MLRNHQANPPTRIPVTVRMRKPEPRPRRELWVRECELSCDGGIGLVPKRTTSYGLVNLSARRSLGVDGLDFHLEGQTIWMPSMS